MDREAEIKAVHERGFCMEAMEEVTLATAKEYLLDPKYAEWRRAKPDYMLGYTGARDGGIKPEFREILAKIVLRAGEKWISPDGRNALLAMSRTGQKTPGLADKLKDECNGKGPTFVIARMIHRLATADDFTIGYEVPNALAKAASYEYLPDGDAVEEAKVAMKAKVADITVPLLKTYSAKQNGY